MERASIETYEGLLQDYQQRVAGRITSTENLLRQSTKEVRGVEEFVPQDQYLVISREISHKDLIIAQELLRFIHQTNIVENLDQLKVQPGTEVTINSRLVNSENELADIKRYQLNEEEVNRFLVISEEFYRDIREKLGIKSTVCPSCNIPGLPKLLHPNLPFYSSVMGKTINDSFTYEVVIQGKTSTYEGKIVRIL